MAKKSQTLSADQRLCAAINAYLSDVSGGKFSGRPIVATDIETEWKITTTRGRITDIRLVLNQSNASAKRRILKAAS